MLVLLQVSFENGRIEEFLEAQAVTAPLMAVPEVASSVAVAMAHFHFTMLHYFTQLDSLPAGMDMTAQIWRRLQDWAASAQHLAGDVAMHRFGLANIDKQVG